MRRVDHVLVVHAGIAAFELRDHVLRIDGAHPVLQRLILRLLEDTQGRLTFDKNTGNGSLAILPYEAVTALCPSSVCEQGAPVGATGVGALIADSRSMNCPCCRHISSVAPRLSSGVVVSESK